MIKKTEENLNSFSKHMFGKNKLKRKKSGWFNKEKLFKIKFKAIKNI